MSIFALISLGVIAGAGAGLLAGLLGVGGGIVIVPVVYYGLVNTGVIPNEENRISPSATSLAAIGPAAVTSFLGHWRAGNTDFDFLRKWGPGIAAGVVAA